MQTCGHDIVRFGRGRRVRQPDDLNEGPSHIHCFQGPERPGSHPQLPNRGLASGIQISPESSHRTEGVMRGTFEPSRDGDRAHPMADPFVLGQVPLLKHSKSTRNRTCTCRLGYRTSGRDPQTGGARQPGITSCRGPQRQGVRGKHEKCHPEPNWSKWKGSTSRTGHYL